MPRITPLISDFSAGEIAPFFFGKTSDPVYYKGASQMLNMMPRPQGGFRKRPGSLFVGRTKNDSLAQLYAIKITANLVYLLEFTNNLIRFWKFTTGLLTLVAAQDIVTTYTTAETAQLQIAWMFPDLFISHQNHPPARIRWSTGDVFNGGTNVMVPIVFTTTSYTFTANLTAGSNQLTNLSLTALPVASQSGLWLLTDTTVPANIAAGTYLTAVYPSASPSLNIPALSAVMNNNAVNAAVGDTLVLTEQPVPFQSATNYPRSVAVAFQRVWWGNTITNQQTLWSSIVGVWDSSDPTGAAAKMNVNLFEGVNYNLQVMITDTAGQPTSNPPGYQNQQQTQNAIADSDGIQATLAEAESELLWIAAAHDLIIGSADGELVIPANTGTVVGVSPNTISASLVSKSGSAAIQGSALVNGVVFVQLAGQRVYEMIWQGPQNPYLPPNDLTRFSPHLFSNDAIVAWDFAQAPELIAYFLRTGGSIAPLHYVPAQGVMAWWQFKTREGDTINSIAVQTGPNGDVLFLSVTRGAFNTIEMLSNPNWTDVRLSNYMDASTQVSAGVVTTVAVNAMFNGMTMGVVADGKYLGTAVAAGGIVTLPGGASGTRITVGLLMQTPMVKTLPISPQGRYGSGVTEIKNIDHVGLILYNTLDIQVGTDGSNLQPVPEVVAAKVSNPTPFTGTPEPVAIETSNQRQAIFDIQSSAPLPCEVSAIVLGVTV